MEAEAKPPVPEGKLSEKQRKAQKAEALHREEVEQLTDAVLAQAREADAKRRAETRVGMPLASAGQVLRGYREAAWRAHGLAPPGQ